MGNSLTARRLVKLEARAPRLQSRGLSAETLLTLMSVDASLIAFKFGNYELGSDPWASLYRGVSAAHAKSDALQPYRDPFHRRFEAAAFQVRPGRDVSSIWSAAGMSDEVAAELFDTFDELFDRHPKLNILSEARGCAYGDLGRVEDEAVWLGYRDGDTRVRSPDPIEAMGVLTAPISVHAP